MAQRMSEGRQVVVDCLPLPRWKRLFDVAVAAMTLVLCVPVLVVAAISIRVTMGGPVLFRQPRGGWNGAEFSIFKFRTMTDERGADGQLLADQLRRHRVGNVLRATSIDELPALINVLRGEMSIVGPRPLMAKYLDRYDARQMQRHRVHPGITGLAQVSGRNALTWDEKFDLDLDYAQHRSIRLDVRIVVETVRRMIRPVGVDGIDFTTEFMGTGSVTQVPATQVSTQHAVKGQQ